MNLVEGSDDEDTEELFVESVGIEESDDEEWIETYNVNGADMEFKVNTGGERHSRDWTAKPSGKTPDRDKDWRETTGI